jgi:hypothetical protein
MITIIDAVFFNNTVNYFNTEKYMASHALTKSPETINIQQPKSKSGANQKSHFKLKRL